MILDDTRSQSAYLARLFFLLSLFLALNPFIVDSSADAQDPTPVPTIHPCDEHRPDTSFIEERLKWEWLWRYGDHNPLFTTITTFEDPTPRKRVFTVSAIAGGVQATTFGAILDEEASNLFPATQLSPDLILGLQEFENQVETFWGPFQPALRGLVDRKSLVDVFGVAFGHYEETWECDTGDYWDNTKLAGDQSMTLVGIDAGFHINIPHAVYSYLFYGSIHASGSFVIEDPIDTLELDEYIWWDCNQKEEATFYGKLWGHHPEETDLTEDWTLFYQETELKDTNDGTPWHCDTAADNAEESKIAKTTNYRSISGPDITDGSHWSGNYYLMATEVNGERSSGGSFNFPSEGLLE